MKHSFFKSLRTIVGLFSIPLFASLLFTIRSDNYFLPVSPNLLIYSFSMAVVPWLFPLFSALTGIYSARVFKAQAAGDYIRIHIGALFIPFLTGLIFFAPLQSFIGDVYNNDYSGGYIYHYIRFFTYFSDFSGIDGGFTGGHLWLLFFLFLSSLCSFVISPLIKIITKNKEPLIPLPIIVLLGLLFFFIPTHSLSKISFLENMLAFFFGFFILSLNTVQEQLKVTRHWFVAFWIMLIILNCFLETTGLGSFFIHHLTYSALMWIGILGALTVCYRYFNSPSAFSGYFSNSFFTLFFFSQTGVLFFGQFFLSRIHQPLTAFAVICICTFIFSLVSYEICRRFSITRLLVGIHSELYHEDN